MDKTRADRIYCLKVSSDYHSEVCDECKYYPNCDHMTQDDMTEVTIRDLEKLEQIGKIIDSRDGFYLYDNLPPFQQIKKVLEQE